MMKLKHLFDNRDLAQMMLENWEYDKSSLEMFRYFRISANAIYPFKKNGQVHLLRFCPALEKSRDSIIAELEFIAYLRDNHYNALESVLSKTGDELVQKSTPWGDYLACVFKHVRGKQLSEIQLDNDILFAFGSALGRLHELSSQYTAPGTKRWTHVDVLDWIEKTLKELPTEQTALRELAFLREEFARLPINQENYGLVHYDFELDNVFYDSLTQSCSVIDFDDAMYHWYIMDIEQTLDSLQDESTQAEFEQKKALFLEGYKTHFHIDNELFDAMLLFRRFANLYGYTRITRSVQECWDNEPDWLVQLRVKLNAALRARSVYFGRTKSEES